MCRFKSCSTWPFFRGGYVCKDPYKNGYEKYGRWIYKLELYLTPLKPGKIIEFVKVCLEFVYHT